MFLTIINVIAPVFFLIGAGYLSVKRGLFADSMVDGLNRFVIQFAIPCLLFRATSTLDLHSAYEWRVMLSFYSGATLSFFVATFLAVKLFHHKLGEAVAIGFGALFSNLVLLGLSISERAYGVESLAVNYAIISIHAPFCYLLGITSMELLRANGRPFLATAHVVVRAMFRNSLMIGLGLGFAVNLSGLVLPVSLISAINMMSGAALPAALFGLGGVLTRYSLRATMGEASMISLLSLIVHPSITYGLCLWLGVSDTLTRSVVLMAAMAPGVNAYLFAAMYNRAENVAASTVILATMSSIVSVSVWLWILN